LTAFWKFDDPKPRSKKKKSSTRKSKKPAKPATPRVQKPQTIFTCPHCDLAFTRRLQLNVHRNKFHRFSCGLCTETFPLDIALQTHVQQRHQPILELRRVTGPRRRFTCQVCGLRVKDKEEMVQHMMSSHCNESSDSEPEDQAIQPAPNISEPAADPPLGVPKVEETNMSDLSDNGADDFSEGENMDDTNDGGNSEFDEAFPDKGKTARERHRMFKNKVVVDHFVCNICCTKFYRKKALFEHCETVHKDRVFKRNVPHKPRQEGHYRCVVCKCFLTTYDMMMDHMFRHRGIKPYACKFCPMLYSTRGGLGIHCHQYHEAENNAELILRDTTGEKKTLRSKVTDGAPDTEMPYTKALFDPDYMTVRNEDLTTRGRSVLVCSLCRIRIPKLSQLYQHCITKHPDKWRGDVGSPLTNGPYKCKECGTGFKSARPLREHLLRHYDIKPYMCKFCGKLYVHSGSMTNHTSKDHPDWFQRNTCALCTQKFPTYAAHRNHMREAHNIHAPIDTEFQPYWSHRDYICSGCGDRFRSKTKLHQHVVETHKVVVKHIDEPLYDQGGQYTCRDCPTSFIYESRLVLHELKHRGIRPFLCKQCKRGFMTYKALRIHILEDHSKNKPQSKQTFTCDFCDNQFKALDVLVQHIEQDHFMELNLPGDQLEVKLEEHEPITAPLCNWLTCDECQGNFADVHTIKKHFKFSHFEKKPCHFWFCNICKVKFISKEKYFSHLENIHDLTFNSNLYCESCKKKFKCRSTFVAHIMRHRKIRPHACSQCRDTFRTKSAYKQHLDRHSQRAASLMCALCGFGTHKKSILRTHLRVHMDVKLKCKVCPDTFYSEHRLKRHTCDMIKYPYLCKECGKRYKVKKELVHHRNIHPRHIPCDSCNKKFKCMNTYKRHKAIYHEAPKVLCPECGEMFAFQDQLKRHLQHHKEMKHNCPDCPRRFWGYRQLQQHVNMEHKEKRYICEMCGRALSQKWHYQAHMRCHAGERRYGCEECNITYTTLNAQNYHIRKVHPERWTKPM
jgi:KRAB domain-containing zinc finger protein